MKKEDFPYSIRLSNPKHYYVGLCNMSGQDWVPYTTKEVNDWLLENFTCLKDYDYEHNMDPYSKPQDEEIVKILFKNEEDAMAFKLRWL